MGQVAALTKALAIAPPVVFCAVATPAHASMGFMIRNGRRLPMGCWFPASRRFPVGRTAAPSGDLARLLQGAQRDLGWAWWLVVICDIPAISRFAKFKGELVGGRAADHELLEVDRAVVQVAQRCQVAQPVSAAMALVLDVMQIEPHISTAAGHRAAMAISCEHLLALARRHRRGRSFRRRHI